MARTYLTNLDLSKVKESRRSTRKSSTKRPAPLPFPIQLHRMLARAEADGFDSIVSWQPEGTSFRVHDAAEFLKEVLPATTTFRHTKYKSFLRQLYFYDFARITDGPNEGSYRHPKFVRDDEEACHDMTRFPRQGKSAGMRSKAKAQPARKSSRTTRRAAEFPLHPYVEEDSVDEESQQEERNADEVVTIDKSIESDDIATMLQSIILPADIVPNEIEDDVSMDSVDGLDIIDDDTWHELLHLDVDDDDDTSMIDDNRATFSGMPFQLYGQ